MEINNITRRKTQGVSSVNPFGQVTPLPPKQNTLNLVSSLENLDQTEISRESINPDLIEKAKHKAISLLKANTKKVTVRNDSRERQILFPGIDTFQELWTRDAMYASLGAIAIGRYSVVRDCLLTLLDFQFNNGMISRRIGDGSSEKAAGMKFLGFNNQSRNHLDTIDSYNSGTKWNGSKDSQPGKAPDCNLLVTVVMGEYIENTHDVEFLKYYYPRLVKSGNYLKSQEKDGLLSEPGFGDWKDSVNRGNLVMYTQALYYQHLKVMAELSRKLNAMDNYKYYIEQSENLKKKIFETFWDQKSGYFKDSESFSHFSPDGNLLAIIFGLTSPEQSTRIMNRCDGLMKKNPALPATDGIYPLQNISKVQKVSGIKGFHDEICWPWQNSLYAVAAKRAGFKERGEKALLRVAELVDQEQDFCECYDNFTGKPLNKFLYKSVSGFTWGAGLYLFAHTEVYKKEILY